jgi:ribonuclease Z
MHLNGRKNPLHIYCSKGLDTILKSIFNFSDTQLHFELCFHFNNHNQKELLLENNTLKIFAFPLKHRIPCSGFLFQEKPKLRNIRTDALEIYQIPVADLYGLKQGKDWKSPEGNVVPNHLLTNNPKPSKSFAFCSDTIFDLDLVQYISGVDLLYHEATFLQILKSRATETFHTTASEAGILAAKAKVKKLLIGHYSSRYKETHSFLDEAKAEFSETILAFDGLQLEV